MLTYILCYAQSSWRKISSPKIERILLWQVFNHTCTLWKYFKFFVFDIFIWILYITSKELENLWTMSEVSGAELNLCINAQVTIGALEPLVHVLTLLKLHLLFTCNWFHSVNQIVFLIQFAWLKWLLSLFVIKSNLHKIIQFSLFHHLPLTFLCKQYCLQGNPCIWLFKYCYV